MHHSHRTGPLQPAIATANVNEITGSTANMPNGHRQSNFKYTKIAHRINFGVSLNTTYFDIDRNDA